MNKTTVVLVFFLAALLTGIFVRFLPTTPIKQTESFAQREVGMPLEMQMVPGAVGVAGYSGTPPLLGSEPTPVPERPYDMANDNELFLFEDNKMSAECCPSPFSGDRGCICITDKQASEFASRGGNRNMNE
jgi:hypothetical protein